MEFEFTQTNGVCYIPYNHLLPELALVVTNKSTGTSHNVYVNDCLTFTSFTVQTSTGNSIVDGEYTAVVRDRSSSDFANALLPAKANRNGSIWSGPTNPSTNLGSYSSGDIALINRIYSSGTSYGYSVIMLNGNLISGYVYIPYFDWQIDRI